VLNGEGRAVVVGDIERAVRLSRRVGWLALGVSAGAAALRGRVAGRSAQRLRRQG
ncbi:cobalamin biosynthesis protein, partial [Streptomyces europaeiscabiei]|nr:cobalamin biosynthesis protein [Streptomyces europaeiscabiei]